MKSIFGICSEGNGHCVQALAMKERLEQYGINVYCGLVAKKKKGLPRFLTDNLSIYQMEGFDFKFDKTGKVLIWKTALDNLIRLPKIIQSFFSICLLIRTEKPDVIFNFYEPLVGLTALLFPNIKYVSIGHQHAITTDVYPKINGFSIQKLFLRVLNYVTSIKSKKIALSYYDFKYKNLIVWPPLLRKYSYIKSDKVEDFILVYLMNEDMLPGLISEAKKYPNQQIECFTKLTKDFDHSCFNLKIYNLDGDMFQERMKVCKAVICSGGFESACESILNNKPLFMIPIRNHYEQMANCTDAAMHGYASFYHSIDFSLIPDKQIDKTQWFGTIDAKVNELIENL